MLALIASLKKRIGSVIGLVLLCVAAVALYRILKEHSLADVLTHLGAIPAAHVLLAVLFTTLSYTILTLYDSLALRYLQHPLPYRKIAMASFVSYAMSHTMGLALLSGSSVRYRLYSAWGLTTAQIAKVVLFNTFTAGLGLLTIGGLALVILPVRFPHMPYVPFFLSGPRLLGLLFLLATTSYLLISARHKGKIRLGKREFSPPMLGTSLLQMLICSADLACAASALYFLLPHGLPLPYVIFLGMYVLAYVIGLLSQVPGGLGVFETGIIFLLGGYADPAAILGSLLAFRLLYYVIPLCIAVGWLGAHEVFAHHGADFLASDRNKE